MRDTDCIGWRRYERVGEVDVFPVFSGTMSMKCSVTGDTVHAAAGQYIIRDVFGLRVVSSEVMRESYRMLSVQSDRYEPGDRVWYGSEKAVVVRVISKKTVEVTTTSDGVNRRVRVTSIRAATERHGAWTRSSS
jgi:hypothetical protein